MNRIEVERLRQILRQHLESLHRSGIVELPRSQRHVDLARIALAPPESVRRTATSASPPASQSQQRSSSPPASQSPSASPSASKTPPSTSASSATGASKPAQTSQTSGRSSGAGAASPSTPPLSQDRIAGHYGPSLPRDERILELERLAAEVAVCTRCEVLAKCRTQTVFGTGNPTPRLVFFGEAPGADEDIQGEPFVGAAGQLLTRIIEACKMKREDVYIMNTVKCRPPQNRNPSEEEIANCWEYAERQFDILQPEFICCLGAVAARTLLNNRSPIGRLRGRFFQYRDSRVMVTYHPAYLLRQPSAKRAVWDDMKMLMAAMGVDLS